MILWQHTHVLPLAHARGAAVGPGRKKKKKPKPSATCYGSKSHHVSASRGASLPAAKCGAMYVEDRLEQCKWKRLEERGGRWSTRTCPTRLYGQVVKALQSCWTVSLRNSTKPESFLTRSVTIHKLFLSIIKCVKSQ